MLIRVHDGGEVEFDHAGLFDAACGERQLELEQGAERRGVTLTQRNQHYHGAPGGGALIAAAGASGDPSLARATALAAEPARSPAGGRRRRTTLVRPLRRARPASAGGRHERRRHRRKPARAHPGGRLRRTLLLEEQLDEAQQSQAQVLLDRARASTTSWSPAPARRGG